MRTISNLLSLEGRIFVYLKNEKLQRQFLRDAEAEGFTFHDGTKPTLRPIDSIYALNRDHTINYVGIVGHVAYDYAVTVSGRRLIRINYEQYLTGHKTENQENDPNQLYRDVDSIWK